MGPKNTDNLDKNEDRFDDGTIVSRDLNYENQVIKPIIDSNNKNILKKLTMKKLLIGLLIALFYIPLLLFFILALLFIVQGAIRENKFSSYADNLKKELNSLVIIDGVPIKSKVFYNNDRLTGGQFPQISSRAFASITVNNKLSLLETEVNNNLSKFGYVREGVDNPYYSTNSENTSFNAILLRYSKDNKAINVIYKFDKSYICPEQYICKYTPNNNPTDSSYPLSSYGNLTVINIEVSLFDKSSDYYSSNFYF